MRYPTRRAFLFGALASLGAAACGSGSAAPAAETTLPASTAPTTVARTANTDPSTTQPAGSRDIAPEAASFVSAATSGRPEVALTFHTNGDLGLAQSLLDVTTDRRVSITCFIVGAWLEANPTWGARLREAGHELANHTYSHPTFANLDAQGMAAEITRCRDLLERTTGNPGRFFRPSGTADGVTAPGDEVLRQSGAAGYSVVAGFDVDPLDYQDPGSAAVTERTLDAVGGGSIVSLHFGHAGTVQALPDILDGLDARGLQPVTLSDLLA